MDPMRSLAERHQKLAADYGHYTDRLVEVLARKPAAWVAIRKTVGSDTAAERAWAATQDGIDETGLRLRLKSIEKQIGAVKTMISVRDGESRNAY